MEHQSTVISNVKENNKKAKSYQTCFADLKLREDRLVFPHKLVPKFPPKQSCCYQGHCLVVLEAVGNVKKEQVSNEHDEYNANSLSNAAQIFT